VEAIVMNASGCGVTVKEYGHMLRRPGLRGQGARISALTRDLSELLPELAAKLQGQGVKASRRPGGFSPPCTLQHGQQLRGGVEKHLGELGFQMQRHATSRTCAAARPAPTQRAEPELRYSCATASWAICRKWQPESSSAPTSAASPTLQSGTTRQ
jgi:glycolate oxidase iron-sulfur subunit